MEQQESMTFIEHWKELRKRLMWCALFFALAFAVGMVIAVPVIRHLTEFVHTRDIALNAFSPWDGIRIYMQVATFVSIGLSFPFILFQLWLFVRPGLREHERKASLIYIPFAVFLLLVGAAFAYFVVFPMAFYFTGVLTKAMGLVETFGMVQYLSFLMNIMMPVSLLFQLPVVVLFLTKIRILNPQRLAKFRRHAILVLLIVAALITPPDLISALIVAAPMILLYEFSILLSRRVYRRQLAADKAWEAEYGAR